MNNYWKTLCAALLAVASLSTNAQSGATINSPSEKLFGSNVSYSATMEMQTGREKPVITKVFAHQGKSRMEMDMAKMLGSALPPEMMAEMRKSGMDKFILLYLPEKKAIYQIQPSIRGYLETSFPQDATLETRESQIESTVLGAETVEGHPCQKNKTIVTDPKGKKHEFVVWNATDLNNFPVKIESTTLGKPQTTVYRNIKLAAPDAKLFELPTGYRKYRDIGTMMQEMMTKHLSAGIGQ
jgi:hypothetical protein